MNTSADEPRLYRDLNYYSPERMAQYFFQIQAVRECQAARVLEVGIGPGVVTGILRQTGIEVITCDLEASLHPDVCADLRHLPLPDDAVDMILCCQVLEHLPFEEFSAALKSLRRVTRQWILFSIPYAAKALYAIYKMPLGRKKSFVLHFPWIPNSQAMDAGHYWEMGKKGYSKSKIQNAITQTGLWIHKEFIPAEAPNNQYFLLRKKA